MNSYRPHTPARVVAAWLACAAALAAGLAPLAARAQKYPEHPIRVVNTFPAGGSGDAVLRIVTEKVGTAMGQPFVIDTRTGAAGSIGSANVANSPADGYSLLLGTASTFGTNSATMKNLPYDPVRDFTPVVMMATTPYLLLVHPSMPAQNLKEWVAYVKANPGKLNYGSFGLGSSNHLTYELLREATGMDIVHVPYKGGAPLITALMAGEVQSSMDVYATAYPNVRAGRFKLLGIASAWRFSLLPEVPTLTEQGAAVEGGTFFALLGPAKMPVAMVETLNREFNRALQMPEVKEKLGALGAEPVGGTPEALTGTIARELQKWAQLVKVRNLKFE
ncbi:MAG TPA: tripartite tricarboxylate transporter substrate binding protein [Burkholderiales bacterium]|jgi:tripartite-type tricarboxylate transporter receptor subunit TctC|nr:tripartite tricarboxylate transporter substrate binding protein [Burkholderiales bacterium]